jgi:hypothetical protein
MAEAVISPGVFLRENDLSQIEEGPIAAGAAVVGPTVKGVINVPTLVTSYADYKQKFGTVFNYAGNTEEYLTSLTAYDYFQQGGESLLVTRVVSGSSVSNPNGGYLPATASIPATGGGSSLIIETLAFGSDQNNNQGATSAISGSLPSGSMNNIRWEIINSDTNTGLFTLIVRRGDDYHQKKTILETWTNLSLDPSSTNYVEYRIGNIYREPVEEQDNPGEFYVDTNGEYETKSRYIRVKSVSSQPTYFLTNGAVNPAATGSMPIVGSGSLNGSFSGGAGDAYGGLTGGVALNLFKDIPSTSATTAANNTQGVVSGNYEVALSILKNKDWYDFEVLYVPGLTAQNAQPRIKQLLEVVEYRGDAIAIIDPVSVGQTTTDAVSATAVLDSSYGAAYWPWVSIRSNETGKLRTVPASVVIPGAYAYNDKVAADWWAPAGFNRAALPAVVSPELRLNRASRDRLYNGKVNPIGIFPGLGTTIYGQKTLQTAKTATDRVNVRRLLIELKRTIGRIAETYLFEQNTVATRTRFINQVTPYLETVQQRQGLTAYRVIMDETNNTPDVIDRNQMVGRIELQPTRTAEFIILDFSILPTGATFGNTTG